MALVAGGEADHRQILPVRADRQGQGCFYPQLLELGMGIGLRLLVIDGDWGTGEERIYGG